MSQYFTVFQVSKSAERAKIGTVSCFPPVKKQLTGRGRRRIPKASVGGNSHCHDGFVISVAAAVRLPWRPGVRNNSFSVRQ